MAARKRIRRRSTSSSAVDRNPRRGMQLVSDDVKAIIYRHKDTGELMVHAFGPRGEEIEPRLRGSTLTVRRMPRGRTGTKAIALPGGRWLFEHESGLPLWQDFPLS